MKRIIFTVTNDLSHDQRMIRICSTLQSAGYQCTLVGRELKHSEALEQRPFEQVRLKCFFEKGKLFYLEYNYRLLQYLRSQKTDAVCAIDLDTLLPCSIYTRQGQTALVFDSHEYFSQLEEVISRPLVHYIWSRLEALLIPRIEHGYTISQGFAEMYSKNFGKSFEVIRNVPVLEPLSLRMPHQRILIYQGALNIGRGLEESILAMRHLPDLVLHIYGKGPIESKLRAIIKKEKLQDRIKMKGAVSPDKLREITAGAWLGLCLFSEKGEHHKHSLANRFFDYMHAGIPQIAIGFPEYERFNQEAQVAELVDNIKPTTLARSINEMLIDPLHYERLQANCKAAREYHNWQNESKKLVAFYQNLPL